jgi:ankyrin repeat protein
MTQLNMSFFDACAAGETEMVRELLKNENINPQYANNEPLEIALLNGHYEIVYILLKNPRVMQDYINLARICISHIVDMRSSLSVVCEN